MADFLLHLCPPGADRAEIELPLDKSLIAARLRMQPETFSRSLARLARQTAGGRVVVGDVRRLRARSGPEA